MADQDYFKWIEWAIAVAVVLGGIYLGISPWIPHLLNPVGVSSAVLKAISSAVGLTIFGGLYTVPGLALAGGIVSNKTIVRKNSLLACYMMILFSQLLSIATHGFLPVSFIPPLAVAAIAAILWLRYKGKEKHEGEA